MICQLILYVLNVMSVCKTLPLFLCSAHMKHSLTCLNHKLWSSVLLINFKTLNLMKIWRNRDKSISVTGRSFTLKSKRKTPIYYTLHWFMFNIVKVKFDQLTLLWTTPIPQRHIESAVSLLKFSLKSWACELNFNELSAFLFYCYF